MGLLSFDECVLHFIYIVHPEDGPHFDSTGCWVCTPDFLCAFYLWPFLLTVFMLVVHAITVYVFFVVALVWHWCSGIQCSWWWQQAKWVIWCEDSEGCTRTCWYSSVNWTGKYAVVLTIIFCWALLLDLSSVFFLYGRTVSLIILWGIFAVFSSNPLKLELAVYTVYGVS